MSFRRSLPRALWSQLLWVGAAGWAFAAFVTERVLELRASPLRTVLLTLASLTVVAGASWAASRLSRSPLRWVPWLLLLCVLGRIWHRRVLRQGYEASAPLRTVGPSESLSRPITTTDLVLRYYGLSSNRISLERLRLVVLADLHITPALPADYYDHVFELVSAQDADLILMAGDYVSEAEYFDLAMRLLARRWPARFGTFAVLGNHDLWTDPARVRAALGSGGVTLVGGRCQDLPENLGRIAICGTEAPWGPELSSALDRSALNLVLSHTPDNIYRLAEQGASIVFAGHTHGGQIRAPGFGSVVVPSRFGVLFDQGHFRVEGSDFFVSAGVGADMPALRIYCQPEILVIDIARQ